VRHTAAGVLLDFSASARHNSVWPWGDGVGRCGGVAYCGRKNVLRRLERHPKRDNTVTDMG